MRVVVEGVWKFKFPLKTHISMWPFLNNKALTWDIIQKINAHGPRRCPLICGNEKANYHLIMICPCTIQFWKEVEIITELRNIWSGGSIEDGLRA
jgi:hypothetical protein